MILHLFCDLSTVNLHNKLRVIFKLNGMSEYSKQVTLLSLYICNNESFDMKILPKYAVLDNIKNFKSL